MVPPALFILLRTLRISEPDPQAKSSTLSRHSTGLRFLAVQRDDGGEDIGHLLRGVKLASLLARPGGKLADQVFIGIAQRVDVRGELRQPFGDLLDDGAELGVPILILLAQLRRTQIDLGKQSLEGALKGFHLGNYSGSSPQTFLSEKSLHFPLDSL
jgi:hypothetical protein